MKIKIEKNEYYTKLEIPNAVLDVNMDAEISKLYEESISKEAFVEVVTKKYGSEFIDELDTYEMLRNIMYFVTYLTLKEKGYRYLGFDYHPGYMGSLSANSVINSIHISNLDNEVIFEIGEIGKKFLGVFNDYKATLLNLAVEESFPFYLEDFIGKNNDLKSLYKEFHNFPLGERFKDIPDGNGLNGPIDKLVVGAVTLLNKLNFETWSSCSGHFRFDENGSASVTAPNVLLQLDDKSYKELTDFTVTDPRFNIISITPFLNRNEILCFKLESGNNLILEAHDGSERAIILSYYISTLNLFLLSYYKSKIS